MAVLALIKSPLGLEDVLALGRQPVVTGLPLGPLDYRAENVALGRTGVQDLSHPEARLIHAGAAGGGVDRRRPP